MEVRVILEYRFFIDPEGQVYTESSYSYDFWLRYLNVFSSVAIVARACPVAQTEVSTKWKEVTGPDVSFLPIPYYHGIADLVKKMPKIMSAIKKISKDSRAAYIFRMPSIIGVLFFTINRKLANSDYGVEMVGDPQEVLASLPRRYNVIGRSFARKCKSIVYNAHSVAYVERVALPLSYPVRMKENSFFFSSISLEETDIITKPKSFSSSQSHLDIISIGSLDQMYKGPDLLLEVLKLSKERGLSFTLTWLGGGIFMDKMKAMVRALDLEKEVSFEGVITERALINDKLDNADLFVLASRTEGLPRAMIEAMARGLPCIGSRVGGIPELLSNEFLFEKDNIAQLQELIMHLSADKRLLPQMSQANIITARRYLNIHLDVQRFRFYKTLNKGYKEKQSFSEKSYKPVL